MPSQGSPNYGDKIRSGFITPAFSGAGIGRNGYITLAFLGVPKRGDKIRIGYITLPSWGPRIGRNGYTTPAFSGVPQLIQNWLHNPCHLMSAQNGDTSKLIHIHIGDGPQRHHLWGEEAQKGKNSNKNRGKRVYRGIRCIKSACVYVALYCLYSRIITQTACRRISSPQGLKLLAMACNQGCVQTGGGEFRLEGLGSENPPPCGCAQITCSTLKPGANFITGHQLESESESELETGGVNYALSRNRKKCGKNVVLCGIMWYYVVKYVAFWPSNFFQTHGPGWPVLFLGVVWMDAINS